MFFFNKCLMSEMSLMTRGSSQSEQLVRIGSCCCVDKKCSTTMDNFRCSFKTFFLTSLTSEDV